ncbi:MAG: 16S rRNA (cytidine(1402)-2'-O)-methyltransferase [Brachybacterium sp.]|nr:16S rRNA (cytidine(1402)-2'-O)-methyltransferase [Brachybacterium sp.]
MLEAGVLTLAATPIGNPLDASVRLRRALGEADLIAAEDTRRLARLAADLEVEVTGSVLAYHEHNEHERTATLIDAVRAGQRVLLVTDAGMPAVNDPGFRAVRAAIDADLPLTVIPGPSAVLTALATSGLAPDRFVFEGFVPRKDGQRRHLFEDLARERRTLVFFDSPRRTAASLELMAEVFGEDRPAALARELTKTHEEVLRGTLGELARRTAAVEVLGEVVLLVGGADTVAADPEELLTAVLQRTEAGERMKDAAKAVAAQAPGISARDLYDRALAARHTT